MAKQQNDLLNNLIRILGVSLLLGHPAKAAVSVVTVGGGGMAPVVLLGHGEVTRAWAHNVTLEDSSPATPIVPIQDEDQDETVMTATEYAFESLTPGLYSFADAVIRSPNRGSTFTAKPVLAAKKEIFGNRQGQQLLLTTQVSKKVDGYCVGLFDVTVHVDSQGSMSVAQWGEELPCPLVGNVDDWTYIGRDLLVSTTEASDALAAHKEPDTVVPIGEQVRSAVGVAMDSLSQSTVSYTFADDVLNSNQTYLAEPDYAMELVEGGDKYYWVSIEILHETDMVCVGSFEATIRIDKASTYFVVQWGSEVPCTSLESNEDGSIIYPILDLTTDKVVAAASFVTRALPGAIDRYSFKHAYDRPEEHVNVVPIDGTEKVFADGGEQELTFYFDVVNDDSGECVGSFEATVRFDANGRDLYMVDWGNEAPC